MAPKPIKRALRETLENVSNRNFDRFCFELRNREEEPRIRLNQVEGKERLEIVDVMVSTFSELGALQEAEKILRVIGCNKEANMLVKETSEWFSPGPSDNSQTKVYFDDNPTFRRNSEGDLDTKPSQEAKNFAAGHRLQQTKYNDGPAVTMKNPKEVEAEARARVIAEGGDPRNERHLLSRSMIQFGKYNRNTFKWLLENDVGYVAFLLFSHQTEQKNTSHQNPHMANKDALTRYAIAYPDFKIVLEGMAPVGFGKYESETLQNLYEFQDMEKIRYVDYLRSMEKTCDQGSKMEVAIKYILQRDKARPSTAAAMMTATATSRPSTSFAYRARRNTQASEEMVQHTRANVRRNSRRSRRYEPF